MPTSAIRTAQLSTASSHRAPLDLAIPRTEFRILGPLEVVHRGASIAGGGGKKAALLARLLLDANRTVPVDALLEALWGEHVPPTAVKMVHVYVSHLRKVLPEGVLRTRPPGYVLEVAPEAVDLGRFTRLRAEARAALAAGDPATGADRLRSALALWRGPALAEFAEPFAAEAARLEELRLTALEERVDADLALGHHADVIGELQALVGAHPLRRHLRGELMLALYRAGRHAEALAAYRELDRVVREELGIEPPAGLRDLEHKILNQDPSLDLLPTGREHAVAPLRPAPRALPDGLVGRAEELRRLELALDAAAAGRGTAALVAGPAGIGKTRLAAELAERARARGATVLTGRCMDLVGAALPYAPLVDALRALRGSRTMEGLDELSRLLPGGGDATAARKPGCRGCDARAQLFEDVLTLLDRLGAAAPVVLQLEDLHWADGSTLDLLAFLANAIGDRRVLLLASRRTDAGDPGDPDEPVRRTAGWLRRSGLAETIELGPLSEDEVASLLALGSDAPLPPALVRDVCARAEGNPFFAQELLAAALRGERALPELLRDLLLAEFARLDPTSRSVVRVAAAAGRAVPHRLLTAAAGLPEGDVRQALRQAVDHDVLTADPARGTYRFRHALIAEAAYGTLLPGEREDVHERL
ncbi:MAG: AAA family ATPase, partial [Solirubrobacterales bacterium]|nr:AAA family ATPase [Solirubrobacterales bacterium]